MLNEKISQSLAGRIGYLHLYPFSSKEIFDFLEKDFSVEELIFKGGYPEIWDKNINPAFYHNSYVQSFIEKDIRQLININNLLSFQQFIKITATRASQEWNHSSIANELGVDYNTVQSWLGLLQNSGIVFLIPPYYNNFGKRLIKRPKLYFNDTGLLCNLLGISKKEQIENYPLKGMIFENYVFTEILKYNHLKIFPSPIFNWRTISFVEIDLIMEENFKNTGIEIKSGKTYNKIGGKTLKNGANMTKKIKMEPSFLEVMRI